MRPRPVVEKGRLVAAVQKAVWPLVADGRLKAIVDSTFPLAQAAQAHARMESGQHVGILMPNCMPYVDLILGCALAGVVSVPINARFKAHEMGYVIENADLVLAMENIHLDKMRAIAPGADNLQLLTDFDPDASPGEGIPDPWYGPESG